MVAVPVKVWVTTLVGGWTWWPQISPALLSIVSAPRRGPSTNTKAMPLSHSPGAGIV